jgi:hypothetical protein
MNIRKKYRLLVAKNKTYGYKLFYPSDSVSTQLRVVPNPSNFEYTGIVHSIMPAEFTLSLSTQYIDIVCSQLTYNQDVKDATRGLISRDMMCRIYLAPDGVDPNPELLGSQPFGIYRQFMFPKQIKWNAGQNVGGYLKFEVYDDAGYLLTESGNPQSDGDAVLGNWYLTLLASEN